MLEQFWKIYFGKSNPHADDDNENSSFNNMMGNSSYFTSKTRKKSDSKISKHL